MLAGWIVATLVLGRLLQETVQSLKYEAARKGLRLVQLTSDDVPGAVVGDPTRLRQVLVNLLGNAIKFTDLGRIVLNVQAESQSASDATLRFSVSDTGIGIPAEKHAAIFEAFQPG